MRALLHPIGILIGHTLPALILAAIYGSMLQVIHPLLDAESLRLWRGMGIALGALTGAGTGYAAYAWWKGLRVHALYGALVFLGYVPLLWLMAERMPVLLPWGLPRWMVPEEPGLYAFRLLSIPLAHALLVLVARSLPEGERGRPARDLLIAAAIPLAVYLLMQVASPFRAESDFEWHAWAVALVCLTIGFLFLLFRGAAALIARAGRAGPLAHLARVLIALVLPLTGLAVNNGLLPGPFRAGSGAFGDLSHAAFYVLALLNAAAVIWPSSSAPATRLVQFVLRSAGFSYTCYFFVLFVPLLPLSVVAIVAGGAGFLLLAPVLLFVLQGMLLWKDARFLLAHRPPASLAAIFLAAFLSVPFAIVVGMLQDRGALRAVLRHAYQYDPREDPIQPLDTAAIARVLERIDANRSRSRWRGDGQLPGHTPFITPLYNRVVLDNLTLGEERARQLARIFLDRQAPREAWDERAMPSSTHAAIDSAWGESRYDEAQQAWRSWVHLRVRNSGATQEEFVADIGLPEGAWVSDHYLVIEGDTARGILAERKSALWVYNSIVSERQDPSIVRCTGLGRVQLRVFPVEAGGERRTGIELLHKEALPLRVGGNTLVLGDPARDPGPVVVVSGEPGVFYVPAALKARLPLVTRAPHLHVIVDGSEGQRGARTEVIARIRRFMQCEGIEQARATLHIADGYGRSLPYGEEALSAFERHAGHGGFFSDRPIRCAIAEAVATPGPEAPVFIIAPSLPDSADGRLGVLLDDLQHLAALLPEGDRLFVLEQDGELTKRSFSDLGSAAAERPAVLAPPPVRAWPDAVQPFTYLPEGPGGRVVIDMHKMAAHAPPKERWWPHALALDGRSRAFLLRWLEWGITYPSLVRRSFQAQVLTPQTAWLCVENEAQRLALLQKQEEVLAGHESLDAKDQEITSMSEPGLLWLLIPLLLWLAWPALRRLLPQLR